MKLVERVGAKPALSLYWNHLMTKTDAGRKTENMTGKD